MARTGDVVVVVVVVVVVNIDDVIVGIAVVDDVGVVVDGSYVKSRQGMVVVVVVINSITVIIGIAKANIIITSVIIIIINGIVGVGVVVVIVIIIVVIEGRCFRWLAAFALAGQELGVVMAACYLLLILLQDAHDPLQLL